MNPADDEARPGTWFLGVTWWPSEVDVADMHRVILAWFGFESSALLLQRLQPVLFRPLNQAAYGGLRGDVYDATTALAASIAIAHVFPGGNKRVAAASAIALLRRNGNPGLVEQIELAKHILRIVETSQAADEAELDRVIDAFAAFLRTSS